MYPSTTIQYSSTDNITISTEAVTIPNSPLPVVTKYVLDTTIKYMIDPFKYFFENNTNNLTSDLKKKH